MTFAEARIEMGRGRSVRRPHWYSSLRFHHGQTVWNVPEKLLRSCNDDKSANPEYVPVDVDVESRDWLVVAA